jgi:hypothetical protein
MRLPQTIAPAIVSILAVGPATRAEVCEALEISPATFARATEYLRDRGVWVESERHRLGAMWSVRMPSLDGLGLSDLLESGALDHGQAALLVAEHQARERGYRVG